MYWLLIECLIRIYYCSSSCQKIYVLECNSTQIICHIHRFSPPNLQRNNCAEQILTHLVHAKLPPPLFWGLHCIWKTNLILIFLQISSDNPCMFALQRLCLISRLLIKFICKTVLSGASFKHWSLWNSQNFSWPRVPSPFAWSKQCFKAL